MKPEECRYEIHMHTTASDGSISPEDAVRIARRRSLNGIAVTDHNTFKGSLIAARAAGNHLLVIYGNEVRTSKGDVIILCPEEPDRDYAWHGMEPETLRDTADYWNCILIAAHPFHVGRKSVGYYAFSSNIFDAVEVWNARGIPLLNLPAMLLSHRERIPATSGSDAHVPGEIGLAPIRLETCPTSTIDLLEELRRGHARPTYAVPGPRVIVEALTWGLRKRLH